MGNVDQTGNERYQTHARIVYCQQQSRTIGQIVLALAQIWATCPAEDIANRVEFI